MKQFTKKLENFNCAHCGAFVNGDGYTNHCPKCLWSLDVDINPGDRASTCLGLMRPVSVTASRDKFIIKHVCEKCGKEKNQTTADNDDMDTIIEITKNNAGWIFGK